MKQQIHIVSSYQLQNKLLAAYLERSTGVQCSCHENLTQYPSDHKKNGHTSVILLDYLALDSLNIWTGLAVVCNAQHDRCFVVLFNVDPENLCIQEDAINRGLQGIFYEGDAPEAFSKGILSILNGELWFSRDTIMKCLSRTRNFTMNQKKRNAFLTSREQEIITLIASGFTNEEISDNLNISPHTVRTHVYNIYKKINATNRIQASLWAAKHL